MSERYFERGNTRQYKPHEAIEAFASDTQMLCDAVNGSVALLEALRTGQGPDHFPWREPSGALNRGRRDSQNTEYMMHRVSLVHQREAQAESLRVKRDPCPVCATRMDIGCAHRRVA